MFKKFRNKAAALTAALTVSMLSMPAFASGGSDAQALLTGVQGGVDEAVLWGIGGVCLLASGIILMIRKGNKATNN